MNNESDAFGTIDSDVLGSAEDAIDDIVSDWDEIDDEGSIMAARVGQVDLTVEEALAIVEAIDGDTDQAKTIRSKLYDALEEAEP